MMRFLKIYKNVTLNVKHVNNKLKNVLHALMDNF